MTGYLATDPEHHGGKLGIDGMRLVVLLAISRDYGHLVARFANNHPFLDSLKIYKSHMTGIIRDSWLF